MLKNLLLLSMVFVSFHASAETEEHRLVLIEPVEETTSAAAQQGEAPCIAKGTCYLDGYTYQHIYEAVPTNLNIRLLGKGVQGKKTNQNLSIACVGENNGCDVLRFIYYVSPQELYFMGPKFKINGDQKALKAMLKDLSKNAEPGRRQTIGGITLIGGMIVSFALIPITGGIPFAALFGGTFLSWNLLGSNAAAEPFDVVNQFKTATNTDSSTQLVNQNGWNWSSQPRRIRENAFAGMIRYFQYSNGFFYENQNRLQAVQ